MTGRRSQEVTLSESQTSYNPSMAAIRYQENRASLKNRYLTEKIIGTRMPNGMKKLQKLNNKHKLIIAMHLEGVPLGEVAQKLDVHYMTVWRVVNDPLAREIIDNFRRGYEEDLKALFPKAIAVVKNGLESSDLKIALGAVDRFGKLAGIGETGESQGPSVAITIINDARTKFVRELKVLATDAKVIEHGS